MPSIFDDIEPKMDPISSEVLQASVYLHPDKPETLDSKQLVPYFESCGMAEDHIVPSGLREYAEAVFKILNLKPSPENLKKVLERSDVKKTLTSAIAAANEKHDAQLQIKGRLADASIPNMDFIKGIDETTLQQFVQRAEQEKQATTEEAPIMERITLSEAGSVAEDPEPEPQKEDTKEADQETTPLEDTPEKLPEAPNSTADVFSSVCPRCGWFTHMPYNRVELTESDRVQFAYSIMQRVPFKKTYSLFNGQMSITFRSKTPRDSEYVLEQVGKDIKKDLYADVSSVKYWTNFYELALLLESIKCPAADAQAPKIKPKLEDFMGSEDRVREYALAIGDYIGTDALLRLITEHYLTFEKTYNSLVDEALDENFYHPA